MKVQVRKRQRRWFVLAGAMALIFAAIITLVVLLQTRAPEPTTPSLETVKAAPQPVSLSSNALFFGNTFWGRYINDWSMANPLKTAYPFSRLNEFDRTKYDAWIAGLECPTVAGFTQTSAQEDSTLSFNCSPDYLPEAAKWFTAFTLANNHTDNRGAEGFTETKKRLEENGIQYFGHYDPDEREDVCEVVAFPVTAVYNDESKQAQFLPVAMCGYHGVFKIPSEESLAVMEQYSKLMPVIAMPHMGVEYKAAPDELKTQTYRAMIDHGADVVIGDHPHWIQNTEVYKGHLIVYSMGNFIFDQQDTAEVVRSAAINMVMSATGVEPSELEDWLSIGKECKVFHDDCLARVQAAGLNKLPMTYKFGALGTNDSGKIVKPATPEQQASILQRLNWSQSMSQLQFPYGSL